MGGGKSKFEGTNWQQADGKLQSSSDTIDGSDPTKEYQQLWIMKRGINQRDFDIVQANTNRLLYTTRAVPGTLAWFDVYRVKPPPTELEQQQQEEKGNDVNDNHQDTGTTTWTSPTKKQTKGTGTDARNDNNDNDNHSTVSNNNGAAANTTSSSSSIVSTSTLQNNATLVLRVQVDLSRRTWMVYRYSTPVFPGQTSATLSPRIGLEPRALLYQVACITVSWSRYIAISAMYGPPTLEHLESLEPATTSSSSSSDDDDDDDDDDESDKALDEDDEEDDDDNGSISMDDAQEQHRAAPTPTTTWHDSVATITSVSSSASQDELFVAAHRVATERRLQQEQERRSGHRSSVISDIDERFNETDDDDDSSLEDGDKNNNVEELVDKDVELDKKNENDIGNAQKDDLDAIDEPNGDNELESKSDPGKKTFLSHAVSSCTCPTPATHPPSPESTWHDPSSFDEMVASAKTLTTNDEPPPTDSEDTPKDDTGAITTSTTTPTNPLHATTAAAASLTNFISGAFFGQEIIPTAKVAKTKSPGKKSRRQRRRRKQKRKQQRPPRPTRDERRRHAFAIAMQGVIDLNKPLVECQEIYNKLVGNHQTSIIAKDKVVQLLQMDEALEEKETITHKWMNPLTMTSPATTTATNAGDTSTNDTTTATTTISKEEGSSKTPSSPRHSKRRAAQPSTPSTPSKTMIQNPFVQAVHEEEERRTHLGNESLATAAVANFNSYFAMYRRGSFVRGVESSAADKTNDPNTVGGEDTDHPPHHHHHAWLSRLQQSVPHFGGGSAAAASAADDAKSSQHKQQHQQQQQRPSIDMGASLSELLSRQESEHSNRELNVWLDRSKSALSSHYSQFWKPHVVDPIVTTTAAAAAVAAATTTKMNTTIATSHGCSGITREEQEANFRAALEAIDFTNSSGVPNDDGSSEIEPATATTEMPTNETNEKANGDAVEDDTRQELQKETDDEDAQNNANENVKLEQDQDLAEINTTSTTTAGEDDDETKDDPSIPGQVEDAIPTSNNDGPTTAASSLAIATEETDPPPKTPTSLEALEHIGDNNNENSKPQDSKAVDRTTTPIAKTNQISNGTEASTETTSATGGAEGEGAKSASLSEQQEQEPLIGYWSWKNTYTVHKMELHLARNSDVALHVVLAILCNQVRYERNALAMTI